MPAVVLVHGGAGPRREGAGAPDDELASACLLAARQGFRVLTQGGGALEAVVAATVVLENDSRFNAGLGSCLTSEGQVEMDAAVMEGQTRRAGAVALVQRVRNPVLLARAVMERTQHVFLAGVGAEALASEAGIPVCEPSDLITEQSRARWRSASVSSQTGGGTVGAVAVDQGGHVAASTSTGGMAGKRSGRIGDSPLIGCGTYADDKLGAASATGWGESIIRTVLSKYACERLALGRDPKTAARDALIELESIGGSGGLILVDAQGRFGFAFNTERMSRAWVHSEDGEGSGFLHP